MAWCRVAVALGALLCALIAAPLSVGAQVWDPTAAISAYSAALNVHDLPAALALFDQYGSATDAAGHHFEGRQGLTEFLLNSGFGSPDARISTENLHIVGNRAVWTYSCSCATGTTEVRLVMSRVGGIIVIGILAGAGLSWWASRFVATLLFGLGPRDPLTFVAAAVLLAIFGLLGPAPPGCRG